MKKLVFVVALLVGATNGMSQLSENGVDSKRPTDLSMRLERTHWILPHTEFTKKDYLKIDKNRIEVSPPLTTYIKRIVKQRETDLYKIGLTPTEINHLLNDQITAVR
jgi:hypothetical protein